eukprot:6316670-Prymnesium_polylepis.1
MLAKTPASIPPPPPAASASSSNSLGDQEPYYFDVLHNLPTHLTATPENARHNILLMTDGY